MNPSVLPQVTVLLCLSVMVPVGIALIRAELLRSGMHYAVLAQHLIVGLALWVVVDGATAIVAAHLKISINHSSLFVQFVFKIKRSTIADASLLSEAPRLARELRVRCPT